MSHTTLRPAERVLLEMADVPAAQRMRWLTKRCAGEPALLAEVHALVEQFEAPDSTRPASAPGTGPGRLLAPGTQVDDFTILGLLGAGAAGVAYIARQEMLGREVALKVLRTSDSPSAQKRFELEAEVLARLDHPGIARVYASRGAHDDCPPYIAMELVEGEPVTDYVTAQDCGTAACLELVARICDAVHHAHQRGVIHRDLKPGNILVTSDGHPKVLDFGVARLVHATGGGDHETQIGQLIGTLPYMSPEQVAGDPGDLDIRTDVYALGVLLYHLLSGALPFDFAEVSLADAARAICQSDPVRLAILRPDLPPDVGIVVACAMARLRERRYESAAALAADLRRAATGVPIAAHRDSALAAVLDRLRRSRLVATAAAAGLIGVMGLAGYAIVQRTDARDAAAALAVELARSTVERGRLLGRMGNLPVAEQMLWERALADDDPEGMSRWALRELYARYTSMWETQAHTQEVSVTRFSPDDRLAISGGRDGRVQVLSVRDGSQVRHWDDHAPAQVIAAGFLSDSTRAFSVDQNGGIALREVAAEAPTRTWRLPDVEVRDAALLTPTSLVVAAVRRVDGAVRSEALGVSLVDGSSRTLWAAAPGVELDSVAVSPEGDALGVGAVNGALSVIDLRTGRLRWRTDGHETSVSRVAWSPDGRWLASGSSDRTVRVWDAASGQLHRTLTAGNGTARSVAFSSDSRRIASAGWWRVEIWDVETGVLLRDDIGASQGWYDARFSSAGDRLLIGSAQGGVRLWDLSAPLVLHPAAPGAPLSVSFDTDRAALHPVIGRGDGRIEILHAGGSPHVARHGERLAQVAVDVAGRLFASAGARPMLRVWRHDSFGAVPILTIDPGDAMSVAMSSDGELVAVGEVGGQLTVVRTDGRRLYSLPSSDGDLLSVHFDETGTRLFTGYRNRRVVVRDAADGRVVRTMESTSAPFVLAYHAPTGRLAAGTWAGAIDVWSATTGERLASLTGHARLVTDLDFLSADVLLSTGRDGTVHAWSVGTPSELALLRQRSVGGAGVRVVDDGQRLALLFEDGHAELFDLARLDERIAGHREAQRQPHPALR